MAATFRPLSPWRNTSTTAATQRTTTGVRIITAASTSTKVEAASVVTANPFSSTSPSVSGDTGGGNGVPGCLGVVYASLRRRHPALQLRAPGGEQTVHGRGADERRVGRRERRRVHHEGPRL